MAVAGAGEGGKTSVLLLGGGDGLAVRELLKYDSVASITVVELDPAIIKLATDNPYLARLNQNSLSRDPRVRIVTADAIGFLRDRRQLFDVILADLPDPNNTELARLYTRNFFRLARSNLAPDGIFVTQATSPFYAAKAFWGIHATVAAEFPFTYPFHVLVPSFGDWGFVMASGRRLDPGRARPRKGLALRYLDAAVLAKLFVFEKDLHADNPNVSTIDRPLVLGDYLEGWRHWGR